MRGDSVAYLLGIGCVERELCLTSLFSVIKERVFSSISIQKKKQPFNGAMNDPTDSSNTNTIVSLDSETRPSISSDQGTCLFTRS
jgi:hypothetical protein